jgi:hypothetical protein
MKSKNIIILFIILSISLFFFGCTEEIQIETQDFEDILVINANITDEQKQQEISLSRTYKAGLSEIKESGARVVVTDDLGNNFEFREVTQGNYLSDFSFAVQLDRTYTLNVATADGNTYNSNAVKPISPAFLEDVRAETLLDENGIEGVAIKVDSYDPQEKAKYFRYEYEETYLIQSLINNRNDLIVTSLNPPQVEIVAKTKEENVCYKTLFSNEILIASAEQTTDNRVNNFQIKFLPRDDFKVRRRYSILVHQFVQSREAFGFYQSLKDFSNKENLFLQTQPGFITGNIKSNNKNVKVLGFFEVSLVSSKRIFFNFSDVFSNGIIPRYPFDCTVEEFNSSELDVLISRLQFGQFKFLSYDDALDTYSIVINFCVDCTVLGTNIKPDFWID